MFLFYFGFGFNDRLRCRSKKDRYFDPSDVNLILPNSAEFNQSMIYLTELFTHVCLSDEQGTASSRTPPVRKPWEEEEEEEEG